MPPPVAALRLKFDKSSLFVPKEVKRIDEKTHFKTKPKPRPMTLGRDATTTANEGGAGEAESE